MKHLAKGPSARSRAPRSWPNPREFPRRRWPKFFSAWSIGDYWIQTKVLRVTTGWILRPDSISVLKVTKAIDGLLFMPSWVNATRAGRAPGAPCGSRCRKGEQRYLGRAQAQISELNQDFARNGWLTTSRNPQFITM